MSTAGQRKKDYGLISDAQLAETVVATSRGLRHVRPYLYDFTAHCKRRWVGEPVLDVVASEFVGLSRADFERAIAQRRLLVNGAPIDAAHRFRDGDALLHRVHRHEEPVSGEPLRVIRSDDAAADNDNSVVIAVDKPASIPVHPGGRFRHLALTFLLARELNLRPLFISHRLDRLTSGVVLVGTSPDAAAAITRLIGDGATRKCYLALVRGHFAHAHAAAFVRVDVPIVVRGGYQGVCATGADGKRAITYVRALAYDAARDLSVVLCLPVTGRTHQIRVHLQHLGFPIANDPLYGAVAAAADNEKRGPILSDGKTKRAWQRDSFDASRAAKSSRTNDNNDDDDNDNDATAVAAPTNRSSPFASDICDFCVECANPEDDPAPEALLIYLHAYSYTLMRPESGWPAPLQFPNASACFRAAVPAWCDGLGVTAASIDAALATHAPDVENDRIGGDNNNNNNNNSNGNDDGGEE